MTQNQTKISGKQRKAITALVTEPTITQAADAANVSRSTLYRWMRDPDFQTELAKAEAEALAALSRSLLALSNKSTEVLDKIMSDETADIHARLRAVSIAIGQLPKIRDIGEIEERLLALENQLSGMKHHESTGQASSG